MSKITAALRAAFFVACVPVFILLLAASPALAQGSRLSPPSEQTMRGMIDWIAEHSSYEPADPPLVGFLSPDVLRSRSGLTGFAVTGGYVNGVLYLQPSWRGTLNDRVTLLHELVHHLQFANGARFACRGEGEREAYELQDAWLRERGADPILFRPDDFTIRILTLCPGI